MRQGFDSPWEYHFYLRYCGGVPQLVRGPGSYPGRRRFEPDPRYQILDIWADKFMSAFFYLKIILNSAIIELRIYLQKKTAYLIYKLLGHFYKISYSIRFQAHLSTKNGGVGGIRTHEQVTPLQHFQCCSFGQLGHHSTIYAHL